MTTEPPGKSPVSILQACTFKLAIIIVLINGDLNQGKLDVVKQEMARVNIDILEISELKWMGIGKFSSDDHYINTYSCEQESLRRNGVAFTVNKSLKCSTWVQPQK